MDLYLKVRHAYFEEGLSGRQMRIIRAEEKANTLPLKMLFPMALCMFPISLLIVSVPIVMTLLEFLEVMSPA